MRYVSTRSVGFGPLPPQPFSAILIEGLAPDGGLAVPEAYPRFAATELAELRTLDYRQLAFAVLSRYADDIPAADLRSIIDRTYTAETFGSDEITPVLQVEPGLFLLRASNGPTLAFKDIALQLLANLFEHVLAREHATLNILGATSGDTGSSAELAMRGKQGLSVFMLSPQGKMSPFQTAQMYSLTDANIFNIAIEGVFDDCQDIVKSISGDADFKRQFHLGAVNSINWARIAAQVVYYFKGYFGATTSNDERVSFAVPSGNFGNVLAGHVARQMGLPIHRLIVATNENDVLDEFFRTGIYRVRSSFETLQTSSPVDGYFQGVELRALRIRSRAARSADGRQPLAAGRAARRLRPRARALWRSIAQRRLRLRAEHPRRSDRHHPHDGRASRYRRRSAYRGRHQGRAGASGARRAAHLHRDGAAGEVRGHDSRGAGLRAAATECLRRSRGVASAVRDPAGGCRESQGIFERPRARVNGSDS